MSGKLPSKLFVAGIDVGSSAVKIAIMKEGEGGAEVLASAMERLRKRDPSSAVEGLYPRLLEEAKLKADDVRYVATTGDGENVPFRTGHFYGMTTHSRGALFLEPEARAIVDIGALHARAVLMDDRAKVLGYRMTSQCASGSGQFLENISRYLGITVEEIGPLSLQSKKPENCSSICAVLAETDVINMVSREISTPDIIKGIHLSMAGRYVRLIAALRVSGVVLVTGGLSMDVGLLAAMEESAKKNKLDVEIRAHKDSPLAGAMGAALWGAFRLRRLAERGLGTGFGVGSAS